MGLEVESEEMKNISEISEAELVKSSYGLASDMDEVWSDESQIP